MNNKAQTGIRIHTVRLSAFFIHSPRNYNSYFCSWAVWFEYSRTCVKRLLSKRPKLAFKTNYCLMQVKSISEWFKASILQSFRPSLSYHLSLRPLFCLFLSGRFTQGLLYYIITNTKAVFLATRSMFFFVVVVF